MILKNLFQIKKFLNIFYVNILQYSNKVDCDCPMKIFRGTLYETVLKFSTVAPKPAVFTLLFGFHTY